MRGYPGLRSEVSTYAGDQLAARRRHHGDELVVRVYGQDLGHAAEHGRGRAAGDPDGRRASSRRPCERAGHASRPIDIEVDLAAAQRVGLRPGDVRRDASTLISGLTVGSLYEQQAIFDVVLWGGPPPGTSVTALQDAADRHARPADQVRLGDVAQVSIAPDPDGDHPRRGVPQPRRRPPTVARPQRRRRVART